jgi:hypothetical protein
MRKLGITIRYMGTNQSVTIAMLLYEARDKPLFVCKFVDDVLESQ